MVQTTKKKKKKTIPTVGRDTDRKRLSHTASGCANVYSHLESSLVVYDKVKHTLNIGLVILLLGITQEK